jgi:Ca2+-binding RTX toxin-like protein
VARSGAALISHTNLGFTSGLTINAGAFNDTVDLRGASTEVVLFMGAGNDLVTLTGDAPTGLAGIGFVHVFGQAGADAIVLNDNGTWLFGGDYRISSTSVLAFFNDIFNSDVFWLTYHSAESLTLNAGSRDDSFTLLDTAATTPVVIGGGAGFDTFKFGDANSGVRDASGLLGSVTIDGQEGGGTLDYSAYNVGVRVNLAQGTATGAAGGVSNILNVTGGSGNDILVGNDLSNYLLGGAGRDVLIGRGGSDVIYGEAGDDILVGDSTVYDLNPSALEDIMREWGRTDLAGTPQSQFDQRVFHLLLPSFGGGLNGSTAFGSSHVINDGVADGLIGDPVGGTDLNWFLSW